METVGIPRDKAQLEIVLTFDQATGKFSITGCDANPIVALGCLEYVIGNVKRTLLQMDLVREAQAASGIVLHGGKLV